MAESTPASPCKGLHSGIIQWLVDNFCICEGYSVPRCLMYDIYMETCGQNAENPVNPATFGKLVHLVFPDLGTRRLGTRGSARYHYDGICIKKSSFFYAQYCCLLEEKKVSQCENHSPIKTEPGASPLSGFRRCPFWEQELAKKYSYKMIVFLADEYCNYCQDILQNVRNQELERVEDLLTSFWKSLQRDTVMLMSLPDVCQLFQSYDVQLYKGIEDVLLHDFLEDVPIQYLKSVRLFSKKLKLWLLNALEGFPALLQISKLKGLCNLISLLGTSTDLSIFLNCLSSNLQAFVFQPSKSKEEFIKLASTFQLRWNFLLTAVSKAMTLCHRESFGSWHLFHLLLLEYVIHILQSCLEEEEEEDMGHLKKMLPDDQPLVQPDQALFHPPDSSPNQQHEISTLKHMDQSLCPVGISSVVLRVLGFLVDTTTGNKLIQVLLEDKATKNAIKLNLPVGQEALVTLKDGQKFMINISDVPQSSENIYFRGSNANM